MAGTPRSESETFVLVVKHYVDTFGDDEEGTGTRRVADTSEGPRSRYVPAEGRRKVHERSRRRCEVPGCTNQVFRQFDHVDDHADGGSREGSNLRERAPRSSAADGGSMAGALALLVSVLRDPAPWASLAIYPALTPAPTGPTWPRTAQPPRSAATARTENQRASLIRMRVLRPLPRPRQKERARGSRRSRDVRPKSGTGAQMRWWASPTRRGRRPAILCRMPGPIYTVIYEPQPEGGYTVAVPALPGCVTEGDTLDEARRMAEDAIRTYCESLLKDGAALPPDVSEAPVHERLAVTLASQ